MICIVLTCKALGGFKGQAYELIVLKKEIYMKKSLALIVLFAVLCVASLARAEETVSVKLQAPEGIAAMVCPKPMWNGMTVIWKGVQDKRGYGEIGVQNQKGKDPIKVFSDPTMAVVFDKAIKDTLTTCGMKFISKGDEDEIPSLSVEIRDFYAGVDKKLLTGKGEAKSRLEIMFTRDSQTKSLGFGGDMDSKGLRKGSIKQLEKSLNELLAYTLKNMPDALREIK